jgi:hypothetical protein
MSRDALHDRSSGGQHFGSNTDVDGTRAPGAAQTNLGGQNGANKPGRPVRRKQTTSPTFVERDAKCDRSPSEDLDEE